MARRALAAALAASAAALDANPTKEAAAHTLGALRDVGAGAEIYVLAQNFLLYITLVIITALLQHYYFPTASPLARRAPPAKAAADGDAEMEPMLDDDEGSGAAGVAETKPPSPARVKRSGSIGQLMNVFDDSPTRRARRSARCSRAHAHEALQRRLLHVVVRPRLPQPLGGFLISGAMLYVFAPASSNAVAYRFAFPSVSNMLSSWCQYEALKYVSFPTQMLFKCFKLFPIMVMGKVLGNKVYPTYDYVVALVIGVGIAVFSVSTEELDIGQDSIGEIETVGGTICGVILLLFFLLFDSFTGQYQARLFNEHPDLSPYQMMFMVNTFSMVFSFVTLVHTHELYALCEFVYDHADMHIHLIVFSLASTVGQLFIFKTIRAFGPVIFAICMNTRIILSILLSALIYGHDITPPGMRKTDADGKPLIKWAGMNDDKSMDVFHEWHEHCDM
ncbi:UDP-galactose transmembrane transporter [Aureococcus anophagefferens]|nr:UDP-galactose transmembrane transporter [Aureococcus anophagefferens]